MLFLPLLLLPLFPLSAEAAGDCYDPVPIVDQWVVWDFAANPRADFSLPGRDGYGEYPTDVAAHLKWDGLLQVSFDYLLRPDYVGLPYTVHRLEVSGTQFRLDGDFTGDCQGPGISFFPRQRVRLPGAKIEPTPAGLELIRVRIWGNMI